MFDIRAPEGDDLLIGKLFLPAVGGPEGSPIPTSSYGRAWSALRHGAEDHVALLGLMLLVGWRRVWRCGIAAGAHCCILLLDGDRTRH